MRVEVESSPGLYCHLVVMVVHSSTKLWEPLEGQIVERYSGLEGP